MEKMRRETGEGEGSRRERERGEIEREGGGGIFFSHENGFFFLSFCRFHGMNCPLHKIGIYRHAVGIKRCHVTLQSTSNFPFPKLSNFTNLRV